jgi:hypothetical protein
MIMKKYILKIDSEYYGMGYIKEFQNDYDMHNDFTIMESVFDATIYNSIKEAKNGVKYCLSVKPVIGLEIYEVEITEHKIA